VIVFKLDAKITAPAIVTSITSSPGLLFASIIAYLNDPGPLSFKLDTVKDAEKKGIYKMRQNARIALSIVFIRCFVCELIVN
tara:strand:+ start:1846 stop:2091 length:246 start_codon:yes stop_codon:yes gene_type:complete